MPPVAGAALWLLAAVAPAQADFQAAIKAYDAGDYAAAFKEWARLAEQGDVAAMRNVGQLYRFGQGTEKNPAKAAEWYRRAADAGLDRAQANLGALYLSGEGVPQNYAEAARWFGLAARHGLAVAQYNLGLLYEHGLGVERSDAKALGWYNLAARAGEPHALQKLSELVQREPVTTLDEPSRDAPSGQAAKPSAEVPLAAKPPPAPANAEKAAAKDDGGLFGFLGNIFGDDDKPPVKAAGNPPTPPAPAAPPPRAAPAPAVGPAPVASTSAGKAPPTDGEESFGDGVLHALGTAFSTNPKAGHPIDDDPTAPQQSGRP
ncbi:MAG TPA: tetratricopeptide repeat protein [Candidatus Sulfotelmatobacter sp.]|nr:tetratricopeptide repeat protein [Candidatus Sulfotelmatobacter sp.]